MPHCKTTLLTLTIVLTTDDKMPTLRKIKRSASRHKAHAFAPHLILPQGSQKPTHSPLTEILLKTLASETE